MTIIGSAEVVVRANTDKFASGAEKGVADGTKSLVGTAAKIIAAAGLGRLIGSVVSQSLADARESNKVAAQTSAVIASTGSAANVTAKQVAALAGEIARKTGVDDEQIQKAQNLILTFTNVKNTVGEGNDIFTQATKIAVDMGTALGTDAAGSAIQLGKALNDPIAGITALTRVGVTFSDAQKKVIKDLQESGDIAGAQRVILEELNKEFGGSAEAVATNSDRLKVVIGNIREDIGNVLIPIIDKVSGKLADALPGAEQLVIDKFHDLRDAIDETRTRLEPMVTKLQDLYTTISGNQRLLDGLTVGVLALAAGFTAFKTVNTAQSAISGVTGAIKGFQLIGEAGPAGLIIAGIVALAAAFTLAYLKIKPFHDAVDAVGRFFRDTVYPVIVDVAKVVRDDLGVAFAFISDSVVPAVVSGFRTVVATAASIFGTVSDVVGSVIGRVSDIVGRIADNIQTGFSVVKAIVASVSAALAGPVGKIQEVFQSFLDWFDAHVAPVIQAGVELVQAIIGRLVQGIQIAGAILEAAASVIGFVFTTLGSLIVAVMTPIVDFLAAVVGLVFSAVFAVITFAVQIAADVIRTAFDVIVAVFQAVGPPILSIVTTVFGFLLDTVVTVFGVVKGVIEGALQVIQGIFQVLTGLITLDWGKAWDGIKNIVSGAIDIVVSIVKGAFNLISSAVTAGIDIVIAAFQGVWDAIKATAKVLVDDVVKFFTDLPGRIIALVGSILAAGEAIGKAVLDGIVSGLKGAVGFVSDIGKAVANAAISAANFVIDKINSAVEVKLDLGVLGSLSINPPDIPHIPKLAAGGIVTARPGGVLANIAEGGRTEGVFPIGPGVLEGLAAIGKGRNAGNQIDASVTIMGNVYGVDDLNTLLDEHDRRLAALIGAS